MITNEKVARYWDDYDENKSRSAWFSLMAYQCACDYMKAEDYGFT